MAARSTQESEDEGATEDRSAVEAPDAAEPDITVPAASDATAPGQPDARADAGAVPIDVARPNDAALANPNPRPGADEAADTNDVPEPNVPEPNDSDSTQLIAPQDKESDMASSTQRRQSHGQDASDNEQRTELMSAFDGSGENTQVMAAPTVDDTDWEARRRERDESLGTRQRPAASPADTTVASTTSGKPAPTTDKFLASLGLFVLRLVTGVIIGIHGIAKLMSLNGVETMLSQTVIPYPQPMALVLGISEVMIGLGLLFGLLVRVAGFGLALIGIGALVFVVWTTFPFSNDYQLAGELELLLGAVGITFLCVGGGRWGIDGSIRAGRRKSKEAAAQEQ